MARLSCALLVAALATAWAANSVQSQPPEPPGPGQDFPGDEGGPNGPPEGGPGGRGHHRPPHPLLHFFDADRDGQLSTSEVEGAPVRLKQLDQNGDGSVAGDELPHGPPPPGGDRGRGGPEGRGGRRGRGGPPDGGPGGGFPGGGPPLGGPPGEGSEDFGGGPPPGGPRGGRGPELGHVLPPFVRDQLQLDDSQSQALSALEQEVQTRLEAILTPAQRAAIGEQLRRGPGGGPGGRPGGFPGGGGGGRGRGGRGRPPGPPPQE